MVEDKEGIGAVQSNFKSRRQEYDDHDLIVGVRRGDSDALREFCARFLPVLLDHARRFRIPRSERETVVMGFLDDLALKLARVSVPQSLPGFVVQSFRNHAIDLYRRQRHAEREMEEHAELVGGDKIVPYTTSEFSAFAIRGFIDQLPDDGDDAREAILMLANHLINRRTKSEHDMLIWLSNRVPLRDIATWMNLSYSAAKVRAHRLRAKMVKEATLYVESVDEPYRAELQRFLQRAGMEHAKGVGAAGGR